MGRSFWSYMSCTLKSTLAMRAASMRSSRISFLKIRTGPDVLVCRRITLWLCSTVSIWDSPGRTAFAPPP